MLAVARHGMGAERSSINPSKPWSPRSLGTEECKGKNVPELHRRALPLCVCTAGPAWLIAYRPQTSPARDLEPLSARSLS